VLCGLRGTLFPPLTALRHAYTSLCTLYAYDAQSGMLVALMLCDTPNPMHMANTVRNRAHANPGLHGIPRAIHYLRLLLRSCTQYAWVTPCFVVVISL